MARLAFTDGVELAFKPRPIAVEAAFQEAVGWLESRTGISFRSVRILEGAGHGWMEWVRPDPPVEDRAVRGFFRRQGALLALSYALEIAHLDEEPVIAAGEHPVHVDVEAVRNGSLGEPDDPTRALLDDSVLSVGILGQRPPADPHREHLVAGFQEGYRTIAVDPERFIREVLDRVLVLARRRIVRPTAEYLAELAASQQPELLRDTVSREIHFNRLWRSTSDHPALAQRVPAEIAALVAGDVPRFGAEAPATSDAQRARDRIRAFGGVHVRRQCWMIESALSISADPPRRPRRAADAVGADPLEESRAIAERLLDDAAPSEHGPSWPVARVGADGRVSAIEPMRPDVYDGWAGVALLMAQLARVTGAPRFAGAAGALIRRAESVVAEGSAAGGGYFGDASLCFLLAAFDALEGAADRLRLVRRAAERAAAPATADGLDLLTGAAGTLVVMARLYELYREPSLLELGDTLAGWLFAAAKETTDGLRWSTHSNVESCCGFAHGAAGIAWAFQRWARASGDPRHLETAERGFRFVRSVVSAERSGQPSWCHGAPGVAIALMSDGRIDDDRDAAIARRAVESVLAREPGEDHSLCHGDLGDLELARRLARVLADTRLGRSVEQATARSVARGIQDGWRSGHRSGLTSFGLMTGLAGVAYGLLQLADPSVPSMLTLELPGARSV